jgi:hypothetical protein
VEELRNQRQEVSRARLLELSLVFDRVEIAK